MPPPASKGNDDPGVLLYAEGALESLTSAPNDLCQARGRLTPSCPRAAAYAGAATAGNATAAAQAAQATAAAQGSTTAAPEEMFAFDAAAESVPSAESYALLTKGGKKLHLNRRDKDITEKKGSRHAHKTRHHRRTSTYDEGYLQGTPGRTHVTPPVVAPMEFPTGREKEHSIRMMEKFADPTNNTFRAGRNRSCSRNSSNSSRSSESRGSSGSIRSRLRLQSPELHQQRNRRHFHSTKGQRKHEKMRGRINPPMKSPGTALEEAKTDELKEIILRMLDCRRLETQIEVQMEQLQLFESLLKQLPPSSSKATDGALGALEGGPADSADSPAEAALLQQLQHDDLSFLKAALSVGLYPACILNTPQGSLVSTESAVPSDPTSQQAAQPKQGPMLSQQGSAAPTEKCVNSKNGMMTPKQGIQLSKQPFPPSAKLSSSKGANAKQGSLSLKQGTLPLKQEPLPVKQGQLPGKQGPLPLKQDPLPLKQGPLPLKQGPPPLKQGPLLLKQGPLPLKQGSLPLKQGLQAPKEGPAPLKQGPLPLKKGPLPLKQGPLPLKQGPLPLKKGPPLLLKGP
ncbi:hypothetical protein, conserved [Eimeria maxima]|uniref:Uncharacterized protein n=1 Tax=Eimeria maxima TaxID=5804 RepID=U6LXB1_EIMMA|nr:hypothetical protein, conserved [Eimeria maxima]CDJ56572.1 hypothetical protein, conserved [Eimeria maxima]